VNDTPPDIDRRIAELFMQQSPSERVRAACEMFDLARHVMVAGLRAEFPDITPIELRVKIFERTYGTDFTPSDRARFVSRLRGELP
jgi:hypothetical protein